MLFKNLMVDRHIDSANDWNVLLDEFVAKYQVLDAADFRFGMCPGCPFVVGPSLRTLRSRLDFS